MIDYKQLAIDCGAMACICMGAGAENLAAHERACRDAIMELMAQVKAAEASANNTGKIADHWEFLYGEELGRRKATELRAEKAEQRACDLESMIQQGCEERDSARKEIVCLEATRDFLQDAIAKEIEERETLKARCARLEEAWENANEAAAKWEELFRMAEERAKKVEALRSVLMN